MLSLAQAAAVALVLLAVAAVHRAVRGRAWLESLRPGLIRQSPLWVRKPKALEKIETLRLTPQHSLHLVRHDGSLLVIAAHSGGCTLLETRKETSVNACSSSH